MREKHPQSWSKTQRCDFLFFMNLFTSEGVVAYHLSQAYSMIPCSSEPFLRNAETTRVKVPFHLKLPLLTSWTCLSSSSFPRAVSCTSSLRYRQYIINGIKMCCQHCIINLLITVISLLCSVTIVFNLPWLNAIASGGCCRLVFVAVLFLSRLCCYHAVVDFFMQLVVLLYHQCQRRFVCRIMLLVNANTREHLLMQYELQLLLIW